MKLKLFFFVALFICSSSIAMSKLFKKNEPRRVTVHFTDIVDSNVELKDFFVLVKGTTLKEMEKESYSFICPMDNQLILKIKGAYLEEKYVERTGNVFSWTRTYRVHEKLIILNKNTRYIKFGISLIYPAKFIVEQHKSPPSED